MGRDLPRVPQAVEAENLLESGQQGFLAPPPHGHSGGVPLLAIRTWGRCAGPHPRLPTVSQGIRWYRSQPRLLLASQKHSRLDGRWRFIFGATSYRANCGLAQVGVRKLDSPPRHAGGTCEMRASSRGVIRMVCRHPRQPCDPHFSSLRAHEGEGAGGHHRQGAGPHEALHRHAGY